MRKTFCDHDDKQCTSRIGRLTLSVIHQTNKGEQVSEDEYRSVDLCGECIDGVLTEYFSGRNPIPMMIDSDITEARHMPPERAMVNDYPVGTRDE